MAATFYPAQPVYYCPKSKGWLVGTVQTVQPDGKLVVASQADPAEKAVLQPCDAHGIIDNAFDPRDPDLFRVGDLHVSTLLFCLKARFEQVWAQYSKMGEMILSVNPFRPMPFNSPEEMEKYLAHSDPMSLPPHVWQIAHKCFTQIVVRGQGNQSVVISGESGSGKTENTKTLIGFLGSMSFKRSCNAVQKGIADRVSEKLKWSNPILESFGNARTVRNDNSSRFGKYTKLYFDRTSGVMVGGEMVTYLLEKSRIIMQAQGERNYHVFYEMLAGLESDVRRQLGLGKAADYACLASGGTFTRRGVDGREVDDAHEFSVLVQAMNQMDISRAQQLDMWKTLAAILHLQEVKFESDDNDKACIRSEELVDVACGLLGIHKAALLPCFLVKSRTKILTMMASKREAEALRDAFTKALYVGLFDMLVAAVNAAIRPTVNVANAAYIGVLDIFGFENFAKNSFEQLCINFANETLQGHYNKYTFLNDEEECRAEGIAIPAIQFPDNGPCLQMFEKAKAGIFPLLDEECAFAGGTSGRFTTNVWESWTGASDAFIRPKSTVPNSFGVRHYAADVSYNTDEWLEKNADSLKEDAKVCVQQSSSALIARLLDSAEVQAADGQRKKRVTVASRFRSQLNSLRQELESTETHFIRCIKPNMSAVPQVIDNLHVGMQLESAGVLQTIALKRQGYPLRRLHKDFSGFFFPIAPRSVATHHGAKRYADAVGGILGYYQRLYGWQGAVFAVGRTKVFLKDFIYHKLEKLLVRKNRWRLKKCVPFLSRWAQRFRVRKAEEERRRQEQLRKLQEEAERRRVAETQLATQRAAAGGSAGGAVPSVGLEGERQLWFQEFCLLFPHFDYPTLADIAFQAHQKDQALSFLTGMQRQQLDTALPANLTRLFAECGFRAAVTEALAVRGIDSLGKLEQLSPLQMKELGMSEVEIAKLTQYLISQTSEIVVHQQLQSILGTADFQDVFRNITVEVQAQHVRHAATVDAKREQLVAMGFDANEARKALLVSNGDVADAAMRLSSGLPISEPQQHGSTNEPPPQRQPQPHAQRPLVAAPPLTRPQHTGQLSQQPLQYNAVPLPRGVAEAQGVRASPAPLPPQHHHQWHAVDAARSSPQNVTGYTSLPPTPAYPSHVAPPQQRPSCGGGDSDVPRPGNGTATAPPFTQPQQAAGPPSRPPPPQTRPAGGVDPAEVQKYVAMGFSRERVVAVLQRCGHDPNVVLSALLSS